jgi:hypothetical protein
MTGLKYAVRVTQAADGSWQVLDHTGAVLAAGLTNAAAWDCYDRVTNQPSTRQHAVNAWINKVDGDL